MLLIEFEYVPRWFSVVVETIPGVFKTFTSIETASESEDIPTKALLTVSTFVEFMNVGLYINEWLGA